MAKTATLNPPRFLGKIGKAKWKELVSGKLKGKRFEPDALALLCSSWDDYQMAIADLDEHGILYRDTNNGRVWNNPAINTKDLAYKQICKLSQKLGLWTEDEPDDFKMPE